ncbi:NAD(P)/FAD-dependent oxidoreductase [Sphaerisporangium sp. TRM90804]|uniref:dihydrolipoyl dehydrogenase family protein n=1 Tax=Sphaerisporangium sp. TRM90804 TaxID=3031113 RepID=UPI00244D179C|nr:NAD(P)/FAD-dependent oxidoreductase [Sphaerisporangium sp. TRM90804]MDH2426090.1 NAD(P)/FAD-dependent oxidoreductase [Sphaerisporangium sp. TRM90804]
MAGDDDVFDVIVIGAGPVGETAAQRVVRGGLTAAVVEERLAGGECAYYACIPSKALARPMELAAEVGRMPGLELRGPIDAAAVLARRDRAVSHFDDTGQVRWIVNVPATFVRGRGRLAGPLRVEVATPDGGTRELRARHAVVVATGSEPAVPGIPGLREARPWTNREATSLERVPERLIVLGGGAVACESAQALHALGARETTVLVRGDRLLSRFEPFAGDLLADSFRRSGIDVRFGTVPARVERPVPGGPVTVRLDDGSHIEADEIMVGLGRRPAVEGLGLETVGLDAHGPVDVDPSMRATGDPGGRLYAVGDVNGRNLLTHMGKYQARVCGDVIAARARGLPDDLPSLRDTADDLGAPQVIFTDPQVCAVGRTEAQARADGFTVRAVESDMGAVAGASLQADDYVGLAKAVVDEDRRVLLGVTFAGPGIVDLLHGATIAVTAEIPLDRLWHAVAPFPTVSEIWLRILEEYGL